MGAQQVAAPDEPSRLPEGAAQPASSHHVPGMRALRVGQRYTSCATRDPDGELPASCRRQTPSALRGAWNSTNGASGEPHECRDHAETFTLAIFNRYPSRIGLSTTPSLDTPATRPRPVQSSPSPAWTSSNIIVEIYGTNQVVLDSTRHTMTYEPSTASSRLQMRQRRALGLSERGRRHRSNENRPPISHLYAKRKIRGRQMPAADQ